MFNTMLSITGHPASASALTLFPSSLIDSHLKIKTVHVKVVASTPLMVGHSVFLGNRRIWMQIYGLFKMEWKSKCVILWWGCDFFYSGHMLTSSSLLCPHSFSYVGDSARRELSLACFNSYCVYVPGRGGDSIHVMACMSVFSLHLSVSSSNGTQVARLTRQSTFT